MTGLIALVSLWFRTRTPLDSADGRFRRRGYLLLAIAAPLAALVLPLLPWRVAAALLVAAVLVSLALIQRRG
jgi:hypothetical protein